MTATILPFRTRTLPPIGYQPPHRATGGFSLPVICALCGAIFAMGFALLLGTHLWLLGLPVYGLCLGAVIRGGTQC